MPLTMVLTVSLIMYNSALLVVFIVYIQPTISISLRVKIQTADMTLIHTGRKQEREREREREGGGMWLDLVCLGTSCGGTFR